MEAHVAWVLNFDADLELAASKSYAPTRSVRAAMDAIALRVAPRLLREGDLVVDEGTPAGTARGFRGRAFCPTPRAVALLARAGATIEPHPPVDVLRKVNGRAFAANFGRMLPGAAFVTERSVADALLARPPDGFGEWRLKREHGMAGRGQRVIDPSRRSTGDDAFLAAGLAEGGLQIEPNVPIVAEYGKHGILAAGGGHLRLGPLVRQRCDPRGTWIESELVSSLADDERAIDRELTDRATEVAAALVAEGYFGPFGLDAFTYRDGGATRLQSLSEINARYSMGFGLAFPPGVSALELVGR